MRPAVVVYMPYEFEFKETKVLRDKAKRFRKDERYGESTFVYNQARRLEPQNDWLMFELSEPYARTGNIERAINLLDTAILLEDSYAYFYHNRGLLNYKFANNKLAIQDYKKALAIDSSIMSTHLNMALAYYYMKDFDNSCISLNIALSWHGIGRRNYII